ncbi:MAG TPA: hypothetical protein VLQ66_05050 [Paenisporosarcina sp.]|nr:hypothetical protein [Paenisporosarcina sp.]
MVKIIKTFNSLLLLLFLFTTLITGCSFDKETKEANSVDEYKNWLMVAHDNAFRSEMTMFMSEFTIILEEINSKEHHEQYLAGRIDGFLLRQNPAIEAVFTKSNMSDEIYENILNPELRMPLQKLVSNVKLFLREIQENGLVVEVETSKELSRLSKTFNGGGSNVFVEKEKSNEILTNTGKMNEMLQGYVDSEG